MTNDRTPWTGSVEFSEGMSELSLLSFPSFLFFSLEEQLDSAQEGLSAHKGVEEY